MIPPYDWHGKKETKRERKKTMTIEETTRPSPSIVHCLMIDFSMKVMTNDRVSLSVCPSVRKSQYTKSENRVFLSLSLCSGGGSFLLHCHPKASPLSFKFETGLRWVGTFWTAVKNGRISARRLRTSTSFPFDDADGLFHNDKS